MLIAKNDKIIVKRDEHKTATDGGIILTKKQAAHRGVVVSAGESKLLKDGDRIIFEAFGGNAIQHEGEELYIMEEGFILAVLT